MDELSLEEKCENLMNVVVETRKRFGKMCVDYEQKKWSMENKILNLQLETISNYRFKPKNTIPEVDAMNDDTNTFITEIYEREKRIANLKTKLKNTQSVVLQLKDDHVKRKLKGPLTTDAIISNVKRST